MFKPGLIHGYGNMKGYDDMNAISLKIMQASHVAHEEYIEYLTEYLRSGQLQ